MLTVNGEKMSKSLGNFVTLRDALGEHPPEVIRYLLLRTRRRRGRFGGDVSREREQTAAQQRNRAQDAPGGDECAEARALLFGGPHGTRVEVRTSQPARAVAELSRWALDRGDQLESETGLRIGHRNLQHLWPRDPDCRGL